MIGKVKQWLGIEGVKLEILVAEELTIGKGVLQGRIRLQSKQAQTVTAIKLVLIERYSRGTKEKQLIDEYELGTWVHKERIMVPAEGESVEVPFTLSYEPVRSPIETFGNKNALYAGLAWAAKKLHQVNSQYRLEAEANVLGVGLNPFDRKLLTT